MPTKDPPQFNDLVEAARLADLQLADQHRELADVRIRWVLSSEDPSGKGCEQLARIVLRKPLERWLGLPGCRFDHEDREVDAAWEDAPAVAIVIPSEVWGRLEGPSKAALVDHLLSHLLVDPETGRISQEAHDVGEFVGVRERHGDWHSALKRFAKARSPQMPLDLQPADRAEMAAEREPVGASA
jgi:hypothetical protein